MTNEYTHSAPSGVKRFGLRVDPTEFAHFNPNTPVTLRCGLCGWTKQTTRGEFPGLHAEHRREKHGT